MVSAQRNEEPQGYKLVNTFDLLITFGDFKVFVYADDGHPGSGCQRYNLCEGPCEGPGVHIGPGSLEPLQAGSGQI